MESATAENAEADPEPHGSKRKRASSGDENSEPEDEYNLLSKYCGEKGEINATTEDIPNGGPSSPRKRKYVFTSDGVAPKKSRHFYYLNDMMTKPRKPKIKLDAVPEKKQEVVTCRNRKLHFARVDGNGNLYLAHRSHLKSDLFFNDEKKCNYEDSKKLDLGFHIVDEISLEGLDGITIEAFWKRLKNIFPNNISKSVADRIWRLICNNKRISFYILKEPRENLFFYDRCKYLDIDSSVYMEPVIEFKDIYPLASVNGTEIRGSCSTFDTRKENNGVRRFSMDKAIKLYDQKLVFVADQALRNKALISEEADPNIELLDVEYCMLEKIGRCRDQGEFTQGKAPAGDSKKNYHNRKALVQNFLIVHQNFFLQSISGGLIHLSRFYHRRKPKHIAIMERIADILRTKPNHQMDTGEFRKTFERNVSVVKLMKSTDFRKFFKLIECPYRKLYPNATKQEYLQKSTHKEKQIRCLKMLDPYANVTAILDAKEGKDAVAEKADHSLGHKLMNYEYLRDIFLYILSTGSVGVTIQEIHEYFKTDFYSVRMAVRKLLLRNMISSSKIDLGRQQSLKFFAKCWSIPSCHVNIEPKTYELTDETLSRVLQGYESKTTEFYREPERPTQVAPIQTAFDINFEPFCCTAFLTETIDAVSEELTIYDIVIKGRDKLLLIGSNLFAHYMSEWDEFLLKREDFSKSVQLFQSGFGKIIYDFLTTTLKVSEAMAVDDRIIFSIENVTPETKISREFHVQRTVSLRKNFVSPHSDGCYVDTISKIYLFEAMFDETHRRNRCVEKMKNIFERLMVSEGMQKIEKAEAVKTEPKIEVEASTSTSNIVMEKFMGSEPSLESCVEEEGIKIEIFGSTEPARYMETGTYFISYDVNLTQRYVNRGNMILKSVYQAEVVKDVRTLYKDILKEEDEEGYDKKACKKSIVSIISKLVTEGYIKCYKLVMTGNNTTRTQCFICTRKIKADNMLIRSTIDQMKLKFYVGGLQTTKTLMKKATASPFNSNDVKESIREMRQLTAAKMDLKVKFNRDQGKIFGYAPKFVRLRVLHELLFYVIRELTECEELSGRQIFEVCKKFKIKTTPNEISEMPPIYRDEVNWKMFIPPLSKKGIWPKGWTLACDIILRMPLSIFVKLYNVTYVIPELEAYLRHPIKRHYLLKHVPIAVRNILLHRRKYFHHVYEIMCNLCCIGLLQMGPRNFKEKDQVFIYLNSKGSLYDTCTSKPGYNQVEDKKYKKLSFEFKSANDVEIYWSETLRICMNTQLGKRKVLDGQCVTIEDCASKPAMVETLKAKTFEGAVADDTGKIPGDRKGSAGFDSSLWSYIKRNWSWNSQLESGTKAKKVNQDLSLPAPVPFSSIGSERKVYLKPAKAKKVKKQKKSIIVKYHSKKNIVRKIIAPKRKRVREYYDATDKSIMKNYPMLRVEWDEEEDQVLRYCKIASLFLCPNPKKQYIPYNVVRDVLHRVYPKSKNKTARAIQRRIYVLLTNDEAVKIMEANIQNLLNSDTIAKYFHQIHNRYKFGFKTSDSQIHVAFIFLMSYISKHRKEIELLLLGFFATFDFFSDSNIRDFEPIMQDFEIGNNSVAYSNPKTVEDVIKDTIKSVVHCSVACRKHTIGWSFLLSRIYKKFSDDLVRSAVTSLKKDQFLVINKNREGKTLDTAWPIPIKFSYVYNLMKSATYTIEMFRETYRNFIEIIEEKTDPEITFTVCNEIHTFWDKVTFSFDIPEMGVILNPEIEDHGEVIEELAKRFNFYLKKISEKKSKGLVSAPDTNLPKNLEKNIDDTKSEIRHLIFRVPYLLDGNLEIYFKKMLESGSSLEICNYIFLMIVDLKKFAQDNIVVDDLRSFINNVEDETCVQDQQKLVKNLSKVVFAIQNIHLQQETKCFEEAFKLWEIEIWVDIGNYNVEESGAPQVLFNKNYASGMEVCIKRAQDGDFPELEEIKEGMMAEVDGAEERNVPHITDLIMLLNEDRFPEFDTDHETVEKMKEHFVMQFPKLNEFIIEDLEEMKASEEVKEILDESKIDKVKKTTANCVEEPQLNEIHRYIHRQDGSDEDVKMAENLIKFIEDKRELGASGGELKARFANHIGVDLAKMLQFLGEIGVVLRAGVASIIYVHYKYQSEWLTETFVLTSKEKEAFALKKQGANEIKKNLKSLMGEKIRSSDALKVQLKPWTKLDGSINEEVFYEWLCIILSKCIDLPNIPLLGLCEQFQYIKPVDIYYILEVLQELGCVEICVFRNIENSFYSGRCMIDECGATCLDSFEEMFVKPTNASGLCFGSFLSLVAY